MSGIIALGAFIGLLLAFVCYRCGYSVGYRNGVEAGLERSATIATRERLGQIKWN